MDTLDKRRKFSAVMAAEVKAGEKLPTASFIPVSGMKNIYYSNSVLLASTTVNNEIRSMTKKAKREKGM